MTIAKELNEIKEKILADLKAKTISLERDRPSFKADPEQLKAYNDERDATLRTSILVHGRLAGYHVRGSIHYNCPRCALLDGVASTVDPRGRGTSTKDFWGCDTCGLEVEVLRGV